MASNDADSPFLLQQPFSSEWATKENFHGISDADNINYPTTPKPFPSISHDSFYTAMPSYSLAEHRGITTSPSFATAPKRRSERGLLPLSDHPIGSARPQPVSIASSIASNSPATPARESEEDRRHNIAMHQVPKLDRTMADVYNDELYSPNFTIASATPGQAPISTNNNLFTQRLQAANNQYLAASGQSPRSAVSRNQSPFHQGSPLAPAPMHEFPSAMGSSQMRFGSAQQMREQSKAMQDAQALRHQISRPADSSTPQTISPKDAMLEFHEPESDANFPPFFQQSINGFYGDAISKATASQNQSAFGGLQMDSNFNFLASQLPTGLPVPQRYPSVPQPQQQSSVPSAGTTSLATSRISSADTAATEARHGAPYQRPVSTSADSSTYTCTYDSCALRFDTPVLLQKHKRESHQQAHSLGRPQQPESGDMTSRLLNKQAGPHFKKYPLVGLGIDTTLTADNYPVFLEDTDLLNTLSALNPLDTYRDVVPYIRNPDDSINVRSWYNHRDDVAAAPEPKSRPRPSTDYDDSGYGSLATKSVALGRLNAIEELDEPARNAADASTDVEAQETRTVFSDAASLCEHPDVDKYITAFTNELACYIPPELDAGNPSKVSPVLDHLLKAFAVRLGHESPGPPQRQLMYLVYRFRSKIIERLWCKLHAQEDAELESAAGTCGGSTSLDTNPGMNLDEKMRLMWDRESNTLHVCSNDEDHDMDLAAPDSLDDLDDLDDFNELETSELSKYREVLEGAPAYQWLQSALRVRGSLQVPGADIAVGYHHIGNQIINAAGSPGKFSRRQVHELRMHFIVDWDPSLFAREQQYDAPLSRVLAHAITVTGQGNNLQAATCENYLKQTWPETGTQLLSLIQRSIEGGSNSCDVLLRDKTRLAAQFRDRKLELGATGNVFAVAEIAEQISWIGAALRSSPAAEEAAYSTAHIAELKIDGAFSSPGRVTTNGFCKIEFEIDMLRDAELGRAGKCWRGMFNNPVIVRGYPIPCRAEANAGLEIPLDMIAALTKCQHVVNFAGMTYLKGFAAMLAAVRVVGDVVFWHLCYNPDGKYISYEDNRVSRTREPQALSLDALERSRHIVGWSDNVRNLVGAPDADYGIEWTELPSPNSTHVLEKVTLSGSAVPFISPGASFLVGVKDKPLHLGFSRDDDYMGNLITIGKRNFVFYDSEERRAWLVDGVSAVLHLLRAYLKFYAEDDRISEYFMYSDGNIEEARPSVAYTGAKAAFDVLTNINNQSLPLYPKKPVDSEERTTKRGSKVDVDVATIKTATSNFTLGERVEQICHVLLQITAYHDDMSTQSGYGWRIKSSPLHQIEGLEFMDVATRHDTLWPKVATIQAMSVSWVHLVRSLRAVTLFGVGFGELFRPVRKEGQLQGCCGATASVPTGKDFLAVYGADLQEMLRTGSKRRNPWRLVGNVHWHSPDGVAFESCKCQHTSVQKPEGLIKQERGVNPKSKHTSKPKGLNRLLSMFRQQDQPDSPGEQSVASIVQVLLPTTFPQLYGRGLQSPARVVPRGAVIFGHCWKFPLRWSLTKDIPPVEGEPDPPSIDEVSGLMSDSGIGTSTGSSSSNPTPPSSSFYSLGNNVGFSHRGGSESPFSGPTRWSDTSRSENGAEQAVLSSSRTSSKRRPTDLSDKDGHDSPSKIRRVEAGRDHAKGYFSVVLE